MNINKEKLEKFLKRTHIPLTKYTVYTSILAALISNIALYYFFKNIIATVISGLLFFAFAIILIRNRNYLREYAGSLPVKACIAGYLFWLFLIFCILFQIKFEISVWLFIIELILLFVCIISVVQTFNKKFEENKYVIDIDAPQKNNKLVISISAVIYALSIIINPPYVAEFAWYVLSTIIYVFTYGTCYVATTAVIVYVSYLKYMDE